MTLDVFRSRFELWTNLVIYEVRKSHVGSALGLSWSVVEPMMFLGTYFFLFVIILKVDQPGMSGMDMLIMMFSGLVPWLYFANTISRGMNILSTHAPLIKQINFPIGLLPFVTVAQVTVEVAVSIGLLLILSTIAGYLSIANLLLVPALALFALFLVGLAAILSCYTIMLPDIQKLLPTALRVGIFITPVLYLPSEIPESVRFIAYINPIAYFITPVRYAILGNPEVFLISFSGDVLICIGLTAAAMIGAYLHRGYIRRTVVDYL